MKQEDKEKQQGEQIRELVQQVRCELPRVGGRKLHKMLMPELEKKGIRIGRDRFFDYLRREALLVRPRKKFAVTTQSSHRFRTYNNLLKGLHLTHAHQAWVSDITYLKINQGFCYLSLITDAWSRKIVGYDVSDSLELSGCLRALNMALKQLPPRYNLIHHSDRGIQYCTKIYTGKLKKHSVGISMAEKGNCYENAKAERINGILKSEFYLDKKFNHVEEARRMVKQVIQSYNNYRPHLRLNHQTPQVVHEKNV